MPTTSRFIVLAVAKKSSYWEGSHQIQLRICTLPRTHCQCKGYGREVHRVSVAELIIHENFYKRQDIFMEHAKNF